MPFSSTIPIFSKDPPWLMYAYKLCISKVQIAPLRSLPRPTFFTEESRGSVLCISHLGDFILKHCKPVEPLLPHGSARPVCSRWHQTGSQAEHTHLPRRKQLSMCFRSLTSTKANLYLHDYVETAQRIKTLLHTLDHAHREYFNPTAAEDP